AKSKPTQKPSGPLGRALSMVHTEQADHPLSGGVFERPGLTIDQMQNQPGVSTINQKPVQGIAQRSHELSISQAKEPSFIESITGALRPDGMTPEGRARAANIVALSEATKLPASFVEKNYDSITKEMGMRGVPTTKEMVGTLMQLGIAAGFATAPLETAYGLASYMAKAEGENLAVAKLKGE